MSTQNAPEQVRTMCALLAWDHTLPDPVRVAFEEAADTIRALITQSNRNARRAEASECQVALLRAVCYGSQKGGAA